MRGGKLAGEDKARIATCATPTCVDKMADLEDNCSQLSTKHRRIFNSPVEMLGLLKDSDVGLMVRDDLRDVANGQDAACGTERVRIRMEGRIRSSP